MRHPPPFATTVVFRLAEGAVPVAPEALSSRALRAYIFDLALSRQNLAPLARAEAGPPRTGKPPADVDDGSPTSSMPPR